MIILGIETSCDETAAAVVKIKGNKFRLLSNVVSSQINIHKKYGGVVPEVAARKHVENMLPVIGQALTQAKVTPPQIDRLAVTVGPGLITSLIVGIETAKTLAYGWGKPVVPVNHIKAHLYANWIENKAIKFPAMALVVSGGHTELIYLKNSTKLKKIGQTLDDAAGEAFDKTAQLLDLGYPGGPKVSKLAEKGRAKTFNFPRPMLNSTDFNFSFAGLKTAVRYTLEKEKQKRPPQTNLQANICAAFQQAVVDTLVAKTKKAAKHYQAKTIMLSGGVAANTALRQALEQTAKELKMDFFKPAQNLCTDNAAMIAAAAKFAKPVAWHKLRVNPKLSV